MRSHYDSPVAFSGQFYGPQAEELAGTFRTSGQDPAYSGVHVQMTGAFAAKKN